MPYCQIHTDTFPGHEIVIKVKWDNIWENSSDFFKEKD